MEEDTVYQDYIKLIWLYNCCQKSNVSSNPEKRRFSMLYLISAKTNRRLFKQSYQRPLRIPQDSSLRHIIISPETSSFLCPLNSSQKRFCHGLKSEDSENFRTQRFVVKQRCSLRCGQWMRRDIWRTVLCLIVWARLRQTPRLQVKFISSVICHPLKQR